MPWLLNEDAALKKKLQGLTVTDANAPIGGRPVPVRFRLPETELSDTQFPLIVIEHAGLSRDPEREHRGYIQLPYVPEGEDPRGIWPLEYDVIDGVPEGTTLPSGQIVGDPNVADDGVDETEDPAGEDTYTVDPADVPFYSDFPIPYNIDYQITVYSRKALHDRVLVASLAANDRIPERFGFLEIPEDGTFRRLDLIGGPSPEVEKDRDGKRIFRSIYAVRVSSELLPGEVDQYYKVLTDPVLALEYQSDYFDSESE
jgi:hypothetical protein